MTISDDFELIKSRGRQSAPTPPLLLRARMYLFNRREPRSPSPTSSPSQPSPTASPYTSRFQLRTVPSDNSIGGGSSIRLKRAAIPPASYAHRVLLLLTAGAHVFLTAGVVFGWASLADVLAAAGAFSKSSRSAAFAIIFTLGTVGNYTSNLPMGLVLDRYGPNVCCTVGAAVQIVGTLLMLAFPLGVGEWCLYPGFFLLGFGGPGVQMATFHLANLFPSYSGSLIAASTALFDAGTAVFFGFALATTSFNISLTTCWLVYLGACLLVLLSGTLLWPHTPFEAAHDDEGAASTTSLTDKLEDSLLAEPPPFRSLLLSRSFLYLVCFASTHILRLNFVVGTFQLEVGALGFSSDDVAQHTTIFASMLPFGFIGMPLIGFALDKRPLSDVFLLVNATGLLCTALLMIPGSDTTLTAAIGLVAVGRQFVYSTFFAQLQRTAGQNYGKLAGAANLCVASFGVLQPVLVAACGDSKAGALRFAPANGVFLAFGLLLLTQPSSCWKDKQQEPVAAAEAASSSMPGLNLGDEKGLLGLGKLRVALLGPNERGE